MRDAGGLSDTRYIIFGLSGSAGSLVSDLRSSDGSVEALRRVDEYLDQGDRERVVHDRTAINTGGSETVSEHSLACENGS